MLSRPDLRYLVLRRCSRPTSYRTSCTSASFASWRDCPSHDHHSLACAPAPEGHWQKPQRSSARRSGHHLAHWNSPSVGTGGKLTPAAISWIKPLFAALLCAWACSFLFFAFLCFAAFVSFLRFRGFLSGPRLPPCPCIIAVEARGPATKKLARQLGAHRVVEVAYVRCALCC